MIGIYLIFLLWDFLLVAVGFPSGSAVKNTPASAGHVGLIPGLGRSPGEGNGNPLQYSCLESHMDRGTWQSIVCGSQSRIRLSNYTTGGPVSCPETSCFLDLLHSYFSFHCALLLCCCAISYIFLFLNFHSCFGEASSMIFSERWT